MNNRVHHTAINVSLGINSYPIYVGANLLKRTGSFFRTRKLSGTIVIITDTKVSRLYLTAVRQSLIRAKYAVRTIIIPQGERQKNLRRAEKIFTQLIKWNIDRDSCIVGLGGGVVGDLSGFVAATYLRGVEFVQIPTTLLAQVDSSVGGKVGVNHLLAKNMIGAFYQPALVIADIDALRTLPQRELISGMGEVIKYGIILDKKFFHYTKKNFNHALHCNPKTLGSIVKRCCELKAVVVAKDEREQNLRAILNFGHTIGHALEHLGNYSVLKHGEAIIFGMIAELHIANQRAMLSREKMEEILDIFRSIPLPSLSKISLNTKYLLSTMMKDKKVKDGKIRLILPRAIGKVSLPASLFQRNLPPAIQYLKKYAP